MTTSSLAYPAASEPRVSDANHSVRAAKLTRPATAQAAIQHKPAKKRNRIPPVKRIRVMQRYASGENQTSIARQEGINRETVGRIVKSGEMEQFTEEIRESWRGLCEDAIQSVRRLIGRRYSACSNRMGLLLRRGKFRISALTLHRNPVGTSA